MNNTINIDRECEIELCASKIKDDPQKAFNGVYIGKMGKRNVLASTDGRRAVVVVPDEHNGETYPSGIIVAAQMWRRIRITMSASYSKVLKLKKRTPATVISAEGKSLVGTETAGYMPIVEYVAFPNLAQVLPDMTSNNVVSLNPRMLAEMARAMGSPEGIALVISENPLDVMGVVPTDTSRVGRAVGVLMPMRSDVCNFMELTRNLVAELKHVPSSK